MIRKATLLLTLLTLSIQATASDEKFLPPSFSGVTMIACGVGGSADGLSDTFVQINFSNTTPYIVTIAKRPSAWEGLQDCLTWIKSLKEPLANAQRK